MHDETRRPSMKDVDHTPPTGASVTNVWHRGRTADSEADAEQAAD